MTPGDFSRPLLALLLAAVLAGCAGPPSPAVELTAAVTAPAATAAATATPPPGQVRPSALAGTWYPADPDALRQMVDGLLAAVAPVDGAPLALLVPHAGYAYSGPVAAAGFAQLTQGRYDVAVILGSDHREPIAAPIAVWPDGGFQTPLGVVPVDGELARALIAADPRIVADTAAHRDEHVIEIALPFLQRVCPACRIVPVLMGTDDEEAVRALADALLKVLPGRQAVVIASSDLSHYPAYEDALAADAATLAAIETGDPAAVRAAIAATMAKGTRNLATCACSEGPILVAMQVAQRLGADTVTVLRYANSGDAPAGDRYQVVGYGAVMFWRYAPPELSPAARQALLTLARAAIAAHLATGTLPTPQVDEPALQRRAGAFVTLKGEGGLLRGCSGHMAADQPLYRVVQQMAVAAAESDPRFPALKPEELDRIRIEIAVLSPLHRVRDPEQIRVGTDGLLIAKAGRQGVLLPQVPVQEGWDRAAFLEGLCAKAGLWNGCWKEGANLYSFTAVVFGEDER